MLSTILEIGNGNLEAGKDLSKYFLDLDLDKSKDILKKLEKDLKNVQKTNQRKEFLARELKTALISAEYITLSNEYIKVKIKEEKERAWKFLNDKEEAEKYGWYSKKPQENLLIEWANKAYADLKLDLWETELDINLLKTYLKTF